VHRSTLQRNAKSHLQQARRAEFTQRLRALRSAWNGGSGGPHSLRNLCQHFEPRSPVFIGEFRKKRPHYLAFLNYPDVIAARYPHPTWSGLNGQLEILRRNSGGYFQSEETLKLKLGIAISQLETGRWRRPAASVRNVLDQFTQIFQSRFERESKSRQGRHNIFDKCPLGRSIVPRSA